MEVFPDIDIDILGTDIYIYAPMNIYICVCVFHDVCFCFSDWVAGFACHSSELAAADVHLPTMEKSWKKNHDVSMSML